MIFLVRTTLEIDDDVLLAAKEIAEIRGTTAGKALSALARAGLAGPRRTARVRNGVPVLPHRPRGGPQPTMRLVNELRDEP